MSARIARSVGLVALLTMVCLLAIGLLDAVRVGPVVLGAGEPQQPPRHAMPGFSLAGFAVWLVIVTSYSAGCVIAARGAFRRLRGRRSTLAVTLLAATSLGFLLLVNPNFLPLIVSPAAWTRVASIIEKVPLLNDIYFHWGLARLWWLVGLVQILLAVSVLALLGWQRTEDANPGTHSEALG